MGSKGQPRRRRPLREAWDDHVRTIMRRAEALERLSEDARFARNVRAGNLSRGEILRSITILEAILERVPEQ